MAKKSSVRGRKPSVSTGAKGGTLVIRLPKETHECYAWYCRTMLNESMNSRVVAAIKKDLEEIRAQCGAEARNHYDKTRNYKT